MKNNFRAVLFDFDGVLAETMEDLYLAWEKAFLDLNVQIKKEDYFPIEGTKVIDVAKIMSDKYKLKQDPNKIVELKNGYYLKNHNFSFYSGVNEIIDSLVSRGIKIAIVSASPREKLEKTVPEDFLKKFDAIITGEDYIFGKPNPEPYLTAMKNLELSPGECIVIENAPLGIKSAKSAGIYCIAITTTLDKNYLKEADKVIESHYELSKLLNNQNSQLE